MLNNSRIRQLRASRLVTAIFAIGLLGFSIAPCQAMVHPQPQGTSHNGSMPDGDCGHCPNAPTDLDHGCATARAVECAPIGPALLERQAVEVQPAAAPPPATLDFDAFPPDDGIVRDFRAHDLPVSLVPLQTRYCSYLK
jgi:hypothetical protein